MQPRLFPLENTFEIGAAEKHTVTVRYTVFGRHVIQVDGKEVWNRFNWWSNYSIHVGVGEAERHDLELRVKGRPHHFSVWLDGEAFLDPLFPELTAERIQSEVYYGTLGPLISVVGLLGWLLAGGVQETTPKGLLMIGIICGVCCALVAMQYRKPRSWIGFLVLFLMIRFIQGKPTSQVFLLIAVFHGLLVLLDPWLRRFGPSKPSAQAP